MIEKPIRKNSIFKDKTIYKIPAGKWMLGKPLWNVQ
jgi:hypothetical protein